MNRIEIFNYLFDTWNEQNIEYVILHSYQNLPDRFDSDIDTAVNTPGIKKAIALLDQTLKGTDWKIIQYWRHENYAAEFGEQDERTLARWAAGILGRENLKVTENTVQLFLGKTGTDMENIQMELEKLICYCHGRDVVTAQDVEAVCTVRISNHIFDMVGAIAAGQQRQALELYYDLLALKEPPMRILFLIARQCNLLLQVKELAGKGFDSRSIASKVGVPPFVAGKCLGQAAKFKPATLRDAVEKCVEAEEAVKTGRMNDKMSVEILILSVLQP